MLFFFFEVYFYPLCFNEIICLRFLKQLPNESKTMEILKYIQFYPSNPMCLVLQQWCFEGRKRSEATESGLADAPTWNIYNHWSMFLRLVVARVELF